METSLLLLTFSSLLLGVNCVVYCNWNACEAEANTNLQHPAFCSSDEIQTKAVTAVMRCMLDEREKVCPHTFEEQALMQDKFAEIYTKQGVVCGIPQPKRTCLPQEAPLCILGLGGFINARKFPSLTNIQEGCDIAKPLLETIDICKSCIGGLVGASWEAVRVNIEFIWQGVSDLLGEGCDCAAEIKTIIDTAPVESARPTCEVIQWAQDKAETIAEQCVVDTVESFQTYDWLTLTQDYIEAVGIYTKNSCFFIGQESAAVAIGLSSMLCLLVAIAFLSVRKMN